MKTRKKKISNKKIHTEIPTIHEINGYKILLLNIPSSNIVHIQSVIKVGMLNEVKNNAGISHLLEHVLVNSWEQCGNNSCLKLLVEKGIQCNAFTGTSYTQYYTTIIKENLHEMLDYITTISTRAKIKQKYINHEISPLSNELKGYDNNPINSLIHMINQNIYCNHGGKHMNDINLQIANLKKIKKKDLVHYYNTNYIPSNTFFIICGNINKSNILKQLTKLLPPKKIEQSCSKTLLCFKNDLHNTVLYDKKNDSKISKCIVLYKNPEILNFIESIKMKFTLNCLQQFLFYKFRYKHKFIYSISCNFHTNTCGTVIEIAYETQNKKIKHSYNLLSKIIEKFKNKKFSNKIINACKKLYIINYNKRKTDIYSLAQHYISQNIINENNFISFCEEKNIYMKMNHVTIFECISKYFKQSLFSYQSKNKM